jgi:putative methionine-R-sulfoxide reductase with GAF domain
MKRHADIGADLLSSIKFPYPVVPIVRHHHENWDGRGYPAGIAGTDIPIGARILSVVDCFDALTSDRPYRPRLSADEAFEILHERRGTMYDPLIVDTFTAAYAEIEPLAQKAGQEARTLLADPSLLELAPETSALSSIRTNASETALLEVCANRIAGATSLQQAVEIASQTLRQLTPATTWALYRYSPSNDYLVCEFATGDSQNLLHGLTIQMGERVTGWTGANRRTSLNSDAALDLLHISTLFTPPLRSTVAIPINGGDRLLGVLTGYSAREIAFSEADRYGAERVSFLLGQHSHLFGAAKPHVVTFRGAKHL